MLKIGSKVCMSHRYDEGYENAGKIFTVVSNPVAICGTECVFLEEYSSCYAVDGLEEIGGEEKT